MWKVLQPLLPVVKPSAKGGQPRAGDRAALNGILFVLQTGIPWEDLPKELGFGSGMTCWRRLRDWQADGVWERLHLALLKRLREHDQIDWGRASIDSATVASPRGEQTNRAESHGSRQARQQTPSRRRPARRTLGAERDRRQSPWLGGVRSAGRCHSKCAGAHRPSAMPPQQVPRR
uniref:Transposase n=1 Tax=Ralstonia solanacearum TaxID=305 RepID=A0A0S4UFG7_RALSL|nr:transposase [Ralstonia solanacearum]CUV56168.1 transposase [Ralstonia solanacearum]